MIVITIIEKTVQTDSMAISALWWRRWNDKAGWPQTWNSQGFLWTWKTQGILGEFCATSGENGNQESIFLVRHSNICLKQLLTCCISGVDVEWPLMKVIIAFTFVMIKITNGKVSLWLWKSLENSGIFFLLLCGHPVKLMFSHCYSYEQSRAC